MASIKAGGSGYFLVNDKPYQRGAYEAAFSGGTAGAETHVRIFAVDTSDGIRNILSLTEISTIESDSGTYADAAELKTALEGFFFRNIGGGSGGAVDSVNGKTGSVILNLDDINDVPPYPNDGGDYVLVENDGSLSWEVNGGGGAVTAPNVSFDPSIQPFANLQEFSETVNEKVKAIVTNEAEFDSAMNDNTILFIYCVNTFVLTEDKQYISSPYKTITGASIAFLNPQTSLTFNPINILFINKFTFQDNQTLTVISTNSLSSGVSSIKFKKFDFFFSGSLSADVIFQTSNEATNFIYEAVEDGITITDDAKPTTIVNQQLWFTSPSRPQDILQDGATDGQVIAWSDAESKWVPADGASGGVGLTYVSNAEEFKAALDSTTIGDNIYCLRPIIITNDTTYNAINTGFRKIYGQPLRLFDCVLTFTDGSAITRLNFYNEVIVGGTCAINGVLGFGPDEPGLSFSALNTATPTQTGELTINGTNSFISLDAIYELKQDGITVSAQANATIQQKQWFSGGGSGSASWGAITGDINNQTDLPFTVTPELVTFDRDIQVPQTSLFVGEAIKISDLAQSLGYTTKFNAKQYVILGYEVTGTGSQRPIFKAFGTPTSFDLQPLFDQSHTFTGSTSFEITSQQDVIGQTYNFKLATTTDLTVKVIRLADPGGEDALVVEEVVPQGQTNINGFDFDLTPVVDFENGKVYRVILEGDGEILGTSTPNPNGISPLSSDPNFIPFISRTSGFEYTNKELATLEDVQNLEASVNQNAVDIATTIAAGIENKNDITDLENNKVNSVSAGTGGVSVTGSATDPVINVEQTTAGLLQNVYFTGEEETTSEGTFYLTKRADRGTVADERQTVVLASNQTDIFPQDFLGAPSPTSAPIISGVYAAFPILQVSTNQNNQRFKIEAYIADADGVPTGVGDGPIGTLGVNTVLIADSGIIDLQANNPTNVNCQGDVINTLTIQQGERFRYRVIAERVGTGSQNKTVTLYQGSDYNSYFQIPAPGIIQPSTPSQYIVSFAKAGLISAPITLETQAGFTQTTGKYFGGGVNAVVKGFRFNSGLGSSIQAADFTVRLNYRDPDAGAPYTPAQGTLLVEETLFSTSGAVAALYNVSGEVILDTPVSIIADKVYFLDISNLGGINFTDLEVEVLIETTPMTPSQFSFPFLF